MSTSTTNLFIDVEVAPEAATDAAVAAKLAEVCPVDIFAVGEGGELRIVEGNLDECVLCRLCIDAAPQGAVTVRRLYDGGKAI
jgi:NAD-dependent dihydropyrimidine dehydrogenase PreA subunit